MSYIEHTDSAPETSDGSPIDSGNRAGCRADHSRLVNHDQVGRVRRRARLQAKFGKPTPTKTTSPSRSMRAALMVISSGAVYSDELASPSPSAFRS